MTILSDMHHVVVFTSAWLPTLRTYVHMYMHTYIPAPSKKLFERIGKPFRGEAAYSCSPAVQRTRGSVWNEADCAVWAATCDWVPGSGGAPAAGGCLKLSRSLATLEYHLQALSSLGSERSRRVPWKAHVLTRKRRYEYRVPQDTAGTIVITWRP